MDSNPKRWVLKPLSPLLQPSDLRTIAGPALDDPDPAPGSVSVSDSWSSLVESQSVLVRAQHITTSEDGSASDEYHPSSPSSSSGSQCGFYSFVEDPASPEAEQNQAWMMSPQRQAHLATLKEEQGFKLQTYSSGRKPESLFSESNGDQRYQLDPTGAAEVVREDQEKQFRKEIIRSQAPRRNQDQDQDHPDHPDLSWSVDRLMLSYSPTRSGPEPSPTTETDAVDKEQINFSAVRQQFLKMEQDRLATFLIPRTARTNLGSSFQASSAESRKVEEDCDGVTRLETAAEGQKMNQRGEVKVFQQEQSIFDDPDSGPQDPVAGGSATEIQETPIQREIRLLQEREENLRRSRGLSPSSAGTEMVQIRTRRLLSNTTPIRLKEKNRVGFIVHGDVQADLSREEPQQQGWAEPDRPDPRMQPNGITMEPEDQLEVQTGVQLLPSTTSVSGSDGRTGEGPDSASGFMSPCCPHRHPEDSVFHQLSASSVTEMDSVVQDKRHFYEDMSLSSSSQCSHPDETQWSWKDNLESTGLRSRGQGAPDFIEKEIEEAMRREQELQELRESRKETRQLVFSPPPPVDQETRTTIRQFYPPLNTEKLVSLSSSSPHPSVSLSSTSFITAQPWTSSSFSSPVGVQPAPTTTRSLTRTLLQDYKDHQAKLKLEDSSYAGIQLIDDVNNKLVESTRVVRHKNQRALRWEAGVFANQEND